MEMLQHRYRRNKQTRHNTEHLNGLTENANSHDFRVGVNTTLLFGRTLAFFCSVFHRSYPRELDAAPPLLRKQ